ncbi:transglutaminase-like putative cysteine protease [Roseiarcus fermentans]|uniref:Transglutaminase-like putative cysteine protease n=1 Tax=Roseiarcus fermentans TaxID=1473586 RepID=A0A366FGZ3_9HYPH|nr:transglutaminase family protein [Roseiarcus fermentans]RBP13881.1 transglutaminase-like putative cysteine protease [Roseiarcus fermentans]
MRFSVRHQTIYRYASPVRLAAHALRLNPRPDAGALRSRSLVVEPRPIAREDGLDAFGNLVTRVDFAGTTDVFRIDSRFEVEFAPAPDRSAAPAPLPWLAGAGDPNAAYLEGEADGAVRAFARKLAVESGADPLVFLDRLNRALYRDIRHDIRPDGAARPPEETLALGHGACRDVTLLFLAACRSLGVPARFVSGYQAHADTPDGRRHLHAWPEAFVPGLGWRAYDPTHGVTVSDGHLALAAAPDQAATMPVEGGYYGAAVSSTLEYAIEIATSAS